MSFNTFRPLVRRELRDEDPANYRWTDPELDRHISRAVREYSLVSPISTASDLATTAGSRHINLASISHRIAVYGVEYPIGQFPPFYHRFSIVDQTMTLLGEIVPDGGNARVYWASPHTCEAGWSTIPERHEHIITEGAAGYAAVAWAAFAVNRVHVGGRTAPSDMLKWGRERLRIFRADLRAISTTNRVRVSSLYGPASVPRSRSSDPGP